MFVSMAAAFELDHDVESAPNHKLNTSKHSKN